MGFIRCRYRVFRVCYIVFKWLPQLFILAFLVGYLGYSLINLDNTKEDSVFYISQPEECVGCPGENGEPVDLTRSYERYPQYDFNFNLVNRTLSDHVSLWRNIPDSRDPRCQDKRYPHDLPSASVIFIFKNERLSFILRSVYSVLLRTPRRYLKEIILVDDNSDLDELKSPLTDYCAKHFGPVVKLYRSSQNLGLIAAKAKGARLATGEVIVFLDAHIEVNKQWLEPLLARIVQVPNIIVNPIIDVVGEYRLGYNGLYSIGARGYGDFTWTLSFIWNNIPQRILNLYDVKVDPYPTAAMAGGLFAMRRDYFFQLGTYDEEMEAWGGENLEQSFRTWMCGGRLEFVPCSRVGHYFRSSAPYSLFAAKGKNKTTARNLKRLAEVWLDDYKRFFESTSLDYSEIDEGDLTARRALRHSLNCQSFNWYLNHIHPEKYVPDEHSSAYGVLKNRHFNSCLNYTRTYDIVTVTPIEARTVLLTECSNISSYYKYYSISGGASKGKQLMFYEYCFGVEQQKRNKLWYPVLFKCFETNHTWSHDRHIGHIINLDTGLCLEAATTTTRTTSSSVAGSLRMSKCDNKESQFWQFGHYND